MVALFSAFRLPAFAGQRLAAVAALLWGFAPAGLGLTYLLQMAFEVRQPALCTLWFQPSMQRFAAVLLSFRDCSCRRARPSTATPAPLGLAWLRCTVHQTARATATHRPMPSALPRQDEVRVLVRGNSLYFTSGYLGHLAVWILDTIHRWVGGGGLAGRAWMHAGLLHPAASCCI